jgi:hypothetical protein
MQDMRDCYDSLLSSAAATANSAYGKSIAFLFVSLKKISKEGNDHCMLFLRDAHYLLA